MDRREAFFECVYAADRNEYVFHLRAWSAEEAESHLRERLRGFGLVTSGTVLIRDPKGRVVLSSDFRARSKSNAPTRA
jgi:hypothetical protein